MQTLLSLTLLVEPDRQRLARFALDAVQALGANAFPAARRLDALLPQLREDALRAQAPVEARLVVDDEALALAWGERREALAALRQPAAAETLAALATRLRLASESADSALLQRRNAQIAADLESARERARAEMAGLERLLEAKKAELQDSVRASQTDSLTGLYNRGGYDLRLTEALLRCQRQREPLSLMLFDLDKFKEINDTLGHQAGDEVLKRMAGALRASIREHVDHPCRMGGDEFAVVLYSDLPIAERVAGKVLGLMEGRVSIGIAALRAEDAVPDLVGRADAALYEAKRLGRGRFASA